MYIDHFRCPGLDDVRRLQPAKPLPMLPPGMASQKSVMEWARQTHYRWKRQGLRFVAIGRDDGSMWLYHPEDPELAEIEAAKRAKLEADKAEQTRRKLEAVKVNSWSEHWEKPILEWCSHNLIGEPGAMVEFADVISAYNVGRVLDGLPMMPDKRGALILRAAGYRFGKHSRTRRSIIHDYTLKG